MASPWDCVKGVGTFMLSEAYHVADSPTSERRDRLFLWLFEDHPWNVSMVHDATKCSTRKLDGLRGCMSMI